MTKKYIGSIPLSSRDNPYTELFYKALEPYGFHLDPNFRFTTAYLIKNKKNGLSYIHVHWAPANEKNIFISYLEIALFASRLIIAKCLKIKIIWTAHNLMPHDYKKYIRQYLKRWILAHLADKIIVHFEAAKEQISQLFHINQNKMIKVSHGNYVGYYPNIIKKTEARNILGLKNEDTIYLYFGLVRPYKNLEILISAFSEISEKNIKLLVAGKPLDASYEASLRSLINGRTDINTYFKYIEDQDVQVYFNACDCVVLPYKEIFTSGAAILAATFEKPLIAKKSNFLTEYFGAQNILVENCDKDSIKAALKNFLLNKTKIKLESSGSDWAHICKEMVIGQGVFS